MPHVLKSSPLPLTEEEARFIRDLSNTRSGSVLRARRAAMLLKYVHGVPIPEIARTYRCNIRTVDRGIDKALRQEILYPRRKDRKGHELRAITLEMAEWVRALSCQNPRNLGYSCEAWPASLLAQHVRDHCRAAGHHALAALTSVEISRLLEGPRDEARESISVRFEVTSPTVLAPPIASAEIEAAWPIPENSTPSGMKCAPGR